MATIISKITTRYIGFKVNGGVRNVGTGRPRFTVWRVLIDGAYYHIRVAGSPNFQIGADINLNTISYQYSNEQGGVLADQSNPDDAPDGSNGGIGDGSSGNNGGDLPDADDSSNFPKDDGALQ